MTQSPELVGGAGFTFENAVASAYLVALLQEGNAPGIEHRVVCRVAVQQRDAGEPLDDVIVDFTDANDGVARLSLQAKSKLTISAARSNTDMRDIVRDCWLTLKKPDFRSGQDRFGAAVREINATKARALRTVCELARGSTAADEFVARFVGTGSASQGLRKVKCDIVTLIEAAKGSACTPDEQCDFFAHFVLIEFDFLHAGGTSEPTAINAVRQCLAPGSGAQASAAWAEIVKLAREGAGKAATFNRPRLVREVGRVVKLVGSASLRPDLRAIEERTKQWLVDIDVDVGGTRIPRPDLDAELVAMRKAHKVVQIAGLPGSGKSALLKASIESELTNGPALFIKSGRLEGTGWASFAQANGLSSARLTDLLAELGATGSATLFIDGIDRIEKKHHAIVTDLVTAILTVPELDNWRIVMSLRDTGLEPLRNWLAKLLTQGGIGRVDVGALNDVEAVALAHDKSHLKPLLFGPREVREIVRRPFFAKVLDQNFSATTGDGSFQPQSEIDLVRNWWSRGGYDADGQDAINRQRAIVELGATRARHLEREISVGDLTTTTADHIAQFVADGILQHVNPGHTLRFAHDIFFEWAFFNVLVWRGGDWLEEIKACGEPPAVGRVVDLLSQSKLSDGPGWVATLKQVDQSNVRSQWVRAWLLAPLSAPNFSQFEPVYAAAVEADCCKFLKKLLVWFQAERTTPNPNILLLDRFEPEERIRIADLLGWPSDVAAWRRLITFLLDRADTIPTNLLADVVAIFEVWQNAARDISNPTSDRILDQLSAWLLSMEGQVAEEEYEEPKGPARWRSFGRNLDSFRKTIARLVIQACKVRPDLTKTYLDRLLQADKIRSEKFKEIITYSSLLADTHADQLVELSLKYFMKELPADEDARERAELEATAKRKQAIRDKDPADRTTGDVRYLSGAFSHLGQSFGSHDWDVLAIEGHSAGYFPPSPLKEPFHSLFKHNPEKSLRLVKAISNHAITAWRQLHRLVYDSAGTPLPCELTFPWGRQEFWGEEHQYYWARGMWGPKPIDSAYLALDEWVFHELATGRPADELIRMVVEGSESVAVLCVAAAIALEAEAISETAFPLVTAMRPLMLDDWRARQDFGNSSAALIGFHRKEDLPHAQAVKAMNERPVRRRPLRQLVGTYFLMGGEQFQERTKQAVLAFKDNLPFAREEFRSNPQAAEFLQAKAEEYAELVDLENYRAVKTPEEPDQAAIVHVSPSATTPEKKEQAANAGRWLQQSALWMWGAKFFEDGVTGENFTVQSALDLAKDLQKNPVAERFGERDDMTAPGARAAAAAMALANRAGISPKDLALARTALVDAIKQPEKRDLFWSSMSVIPWHPGIFAAQGFAADIRAGTASRDTAEHLLKLVAHPLDVVSQAAGIAALELWDVDPRLSWAALHLALTLCEVQPRQPAGPNEPLHPLATLRKAIADAVKRYKKPPKWDALPLPPTPWVKIAHDKGRIGPSFDDDGDVDDDDLVDTKNAWRPNPVWWNSKYAGEVVKHIPAEAVLASPARQAFEQFLSGYLKWTMDSLAPPWQKSGRRDASHQIYEWNGSFGSLLGKIAGYMPLAYVQRLFLGPIFALPGERCWDLLSPFVSTFTCFHVYDSATVPAHATDLLLACLEKVLTDRGFKEGVHSAGEFYNFGLPLLNRTLMFVSVERANAAARYVNGDWSDIGRIMPVIDRFVRAGGWATTIMDDFLTLCERAKESYPVDIFADQILDVVGKHGRDLQDWHSTSLPARIAGLVQHFSTRETPMASVLGQKLLRILDLLVDMGDRRSAALEQSETFREIQTTPFG